LNISAVRHRAKYKRKLQYRVGTLSPDNALFHKSKSL
jgi:hypothetical protein